MKKTYERPQIYVEDFTFSQSIAACAFNYRSSQDAVNCYAVSAGTTSGYQPGDAVFTSLGVCEAVVEDYCNWNSVTVSGIVTVTS